MFRERLTILAVVLAQAAALGLLAGEVAPLTEAEKKAEEQKLIAVLQGNSEGFDKDVACRRLAVIGSKDAIPALAAMLADANLYDVARYGLETIPDPAADDALRAALGKVKGKQLVAVCRSIAKRRDVKAVDELARLLGDADVDVASAAAIALGAVGDANATKVLQQALSGAPAAVRPAVGEGCLAITDTLLAQGKRDEAMALADRVRAAELPPYMRAGGLRAAVLARQAAGVPLIIEHLKGEDKEMLRAALGVARQLPGPEATKALAAELDKVPTDRRIMLIQAIGDRRDPAALPGILEQVKSGEKVVRAAALRILGQISDASAVPVLLQSAMDADDEVARAAKATLAGLRGKEVDSSVLAVLDKDDPKARRLALEIVGERRIAAAVPALIKATTDADKEIRLAAIRVLSDMGGPGVPAALFKAAEDADKDVRTAAMKGVGATGAAEDLDKLIAMLVKQKEAQELQAAEGAVGAVLARIPDKEVCADKLLASMAQAEAPVKCALLRTLRATPTPKALGAVRAATKDANNDVKEAAIRALCEWQAAEAAPDQLEMAKGAANATHKVLALRGYMSLIRDNKDIPAEKKLAMCKEAAALAQRDDEKKLLLGAVATVPALETLAMVTPHLDGAARNEAAVAAVTIGEQIVQGNPTEVGDAMRKVLEFVQNRDLKRRATDVLNRAQKAAKKK
ncbi:MAG: HEAT repeat domain-containing protein [Planctomycetota bacterium]|nr:HEAT repeat domain-containing protein [Planctomycetota bacterium]